MVGRQGLITRSRRLAVSSVSWPNRTWQTGRAWATSRGHGATDIVTTTPTLEGHQIVAYLGIESVEIVIGTGLFVELTGEIADFFGQRSKGFEGKLQNAKRVAFQALKTLAAQQDANAVVGIDLDYTEFSGNRIGLIVNGTLVRTVPIEGIAY
jgi:uncharacterized protein YbjQ (UPF0145 family)